MSGLEKLASMDLSFEGTAKKDYQKLQSYRNVTSFSMLSTLHECPRKFQLIKARAASGGGQLENVHFAFGHSVGAGAQAFMHSGDMDAAIFNGLMAWNISYDAMIEKKHKSVWQATLAIQKFAEFRKEELGDWRVWTMPNGKPALEVSIEIDFENGYKHYLHIDAILEHELTGKLAVMENKTDGWSTLDEAKYANSSQALGYAAAVDMLSEATSFDVFYCVYSTTSYEWELLPFAKTTSLKAEWLLDLQLDHAALSTYHQLHFYPKRGEACFNFARRCEFFGTCNLTQSVSTPPDLPADKQAEAVDFSFTATQLKAKQYKRNQTEVIPQQGAQIDSID